MSKQYETERLILRPLTIQDATMLSDYYLRNREFFREWDPIYEDSFYRIESQERSIEIENEAMWNDKALCLYLFRKGEKERIIGFVKLTNIIYGVFLSCFLGYKLDQDEINKGYITEAIRKVVSIAFEDYGLHRIEANIMPKNHRSIRVAEKAGFICEGAGKQYLKINGRWEDHLHYVIWNESV